MFILKDYDEDEDPKKFVSTKTGRGELRKDWRETSRPLMCAYKLCTVEFKWLGAQNKLEKFIHGVERKLFTKFHRHLFCWIDKWYGLKLSDVRPIEARTDDLEDVKFF